MRHVAVAVHTASILCAIAFGDINQTLRLLLSFRTMNGQGLVTNKIEADGWVCQSDEPSCKHYFCCKSRYSS